MIFWAMGLLEQRRPQFVIAEDSIPVGRSGCQRQQKHCQQYHPSCKNWAVVFILVTRTMCFTLHKYALSITVVFLWSYSDAASIWDGGNDDNMADIKPLLFANQNLPRQMAGILRYAFPFSCVRSSVVEKLVSHNIFIYSACLGECWI